MLSKSALFVVLLGTTVFLGCSEKDVPPKPVCHTKGCKCEAQKKAEIAVLRDLAKSTVGVLVEWGGGSGFVIHQEDKKTWVMTGAHVIDGACKKVADGKVTWGKIEVVKKWHEKNGKLLKELKWDAKVVAFDEEHDLAVIVIEGKEDELAVAKFYSGPALPVGTRVLSCSSDATDDGAPQVAVGVIARYGNQYNKKHYVQVVTAAQPGMSGSLVTTVDGKVIGMLLRANVYNHSLIAPVDRIRKWMKEKKLSHLMEE